MRRKTNATDRRRIPTLHSGKTHQAKFRALLQAGYKELGAEARRLAREFARLDAQSLGHVDKSSVKLASLRGFLKEMKVGGIREKRDRY